MTPLIDFVEMTEWVRFNDDGSSDHLRVIDGELVGTEHWDRSPYMQVRDKNGNPSWPPFRPDCDWLVEVKRAPAKPVPASINQ